MCCCCLFIFFLVFVLSFFVVFLFMRKGLNNEERSETDRTLTYDYTMYYTHCTTLSDSLIFRILFRGVMASVCRVYLTMLTC